MSRWLPLRMPLRPQAETGRQTLAQHRESRANQTWMQHHQRQLQVLLQRLASQWHQRPVLARMPQRGLCQRALRLRRMPAPSNRTSKHRHPTAKGRRMLEQPHCYRRKQLVRALCRKLAEPQLTSP